MSSADVVRVVRLDHPVSPAHLDQIASLLDREWWSAGRDLDDLRVALDSSQVLVAAINDDQIVRGFVRVLTDHRYFAVILDVVVDDSLRGAGVGKALINAVFSQPDLQQLRGIGLQCEEDLKAFYERWGFSDEPGRSGQMKRVFAGAAPADFLVP